jgi:exonuclease III
VVPNNKEEKKRVQQHVIKRIRECEKDNIRVILMGDFNDIRSKELDQNKEFSSRKQTLPLLRWLDSSDLEDVFRKVHPYEKVYTWSNNESSTRIDYIWASSRLSQGIIDSRIIESSCITGSDHSFVFAKLSTGIMYKTRALALDKRMKGKKRILILSKAQEDD